MQFVFIACQVGGYRNILKLSCRGIRTIALRGKLPPGQGQGLAQFEGGQFQGWGQFSSFKAFSKDKKRPESSLLAYSAWLLKKNISLVIFFFYISLVILYSITCQVSLSGCLYFKRYCTISQQARNVYTTLDLGHIYITSYINVYTTLLQRL